MDGTRVLLADNSPALLKAIVGLIGGHFEVVGTVGDGLALVQEARRLGPTVIVADISMPGLTGLQAIQSLRREHSDARIVILTTHEDPELVVEALACGATGYVLKSAADRDLIPAIEAAAAGRLFLSASLRS